MITNSDIKNPIGFFEYFITETGINHYYHKFYNDFVNDDIDIIDDNYVIKTIQLDWDKEIEAKYDINKEFRQKINSKISEELTISKNLIDHLAVEKLDIHNSNYLNFNKAIKVLVNDKINHILTTQTNLFLKYPMLKKGLSDIVDYINITYREYLKEPIFFDETILEKDLYNLHSMSFEDLFEQLFSFLIAERLINKTDYDKFFQYCRAFVNRENIEIVEKIPVISIQDSVLHSLFGIICKKYKHIKIEDMAVFLESTMQNYNSDTTVHTFTKKYSSPIDIAKHPYLSAFVKGYFKKK